MRLEGAENGNNLVIGPASPRDEQHYTCQISSYKPSEIVHSVKVRGNASLCHYSVIMTILCFSVKPIIAVSPSEGLVVREGKYIRNKTRKYKDIGRRACAAVVQPAGGLPGAAAELVPPPPAAARTGQLQARLRDPEPRQDHQTRRR